MIVTYDNMGRLTGTTISYAFLTSRSFTNSYAYDLASNRTSLVDPESGTTAYVYDALMGRFLKPHFTRYRNMLSMVEDVDFLKVNVIASRCAAQFEIELVSMRFGTEGTSQLASRLVVGVDDIPSRWAV